PEFERKMLESLEEVSVGVAWLEAAEHIVAARVRGAVGQFPRRRELDWPHPSIDALFMREVAEVHRELYAENAELYGEDVAAKIERCLAVTDADVSRAARAREDYTERCNEIFEGVDLLLTPTLGRVAPAVGIGDRALRESLIHNTLPFNTLGWPALALPCGAAEDGLPASIQVVGRPGADALVLSAGETLSAALEDSYASLVRGIAGRPRVPTTIRNHACPHSCGRLSQPARARACGGRSDACARRRSGTSARLSASRRRAGAGFLRAHPLLCVEPRGRRRPLPVPARNELELP